MKGDEDAVARPEGKGDPWPLLRPIGRGISSSTSLISQAQLRPLIRSHNAHLVLISDGRRGWSHDEILMLAVLDEIFVE